MGRRMTAKACCCCCSAPAVSFMRARSHSLDAIAAKARKKGGRGEGAIGDRCEELLGGAAGRGVSFASMHPHYASSGGIIDSADLVLERFLPGVAELAASAAPAEQLPPRPLRVLLTGANGFLGRFLLLGLLRAATATPSGHVYALVRAADDAAAAKRLRASYDTGDGSLLAAYEELAGKGGLTVLAGDLASPELGLQPDTFARLSGDLDTILHNGALVNHAYTYQEQFEPNVLGTVEVMRLALTHRRKALLFVSSVGVALGVERPEGTPLGTPVGEDEDGARLTRTHRAEGEGYAVGYGCAKWACEVLLRQAAERYGLPVAVFRPAMIMASSRSLGQINQIDLFTRLLAGLIHTGLAPASFYKDPSGPDAHFDGMPVEFVADSILGIGAAHRSGFTLCHVVNPHWGDGISLDRILGWVESAGYRFERVGNHAEWYKRFQAALRKLEAQHQPYSPLPILHLWQRPISQATRFDATRLRAGLRAHTSWRDVPQLTEGYTHMNLRHLQALGIISPPTLRP